MLHDPARHEALTGTPWSEAQARATIQAIVDDTCSRFDPTTLWPTHPREREPSDASVPEPMLYNGATGAVWALLAASRAAVAREAAMACARRPASAAVRTAGDKASRLNAATVGRAVRR